MRQRLPLFAAALWWGSLTTFGFVVVPLLFTHLATPAIAGNMAAKLFAVQAWVSLGCGVLLMVLLQSKARKVKSGWLKYALFFVVFGVLFAALNEFAVSPKIVARENLKLWHGVGSAMYLVQWVCSAVVLWKLAATPADQA